MKSTLLGVFINLGLALTKCSAGLIGHSFALVADGLESGADVLSGLAVYFGLRLAAKPPDKDHPYGHGKAEPIADLVVGLTLVAAATAIMIESIHQISSPIDFRDHTPWSSLREYSLLRNFYFDMSAQLATL